MTTFLFWCAIGAVAGTVFGSFFEWALHRFVMHKPLGKFDYPFRAHAIVHHQTFKADHTYHLIDEKDKATIPMAWWNGPLLIALCMVPATALAWWFGSWQFAVGAVYDLSKRTALYGTWSGINNKGGASFVVGSLVNVPVGGAAKNADSQGLEFGIRHSF